MLYMMMKAILVIFVLLASPFAAGKNVWAQDGYMQSIEMAPAEPQSQALPKLDGSNPNKGLLKHLQRETAAQAHEEVNVTTSPADLPIPQADFKELREDHTDRVTEVIDPLTLRLENFGIVRLIGLDIPDYNPHEPGVFAESAATILRDMLMDRRVKLYHTSDKSTGRTNRLQQKLYHVVIEENQSWVQGVLVQLGLARVRTEKSNPEMASQLYVLEDQARKAALGLWSK